jgi:hypothetical protein
MSSDYSIKFHTKCRYNCILAFEVFKTRWYLTVICNNVLAGSFFCFVLSHLATWNFLVNQTDRTSFNI